ncbi:hypothetical protein PIB30_013808 [Stylosanthes scabra]|uniref:Uncharacterized protein n=1 Tax=Stylosanthes scabra TaxID=79078 RepID=A0ABU6R6M2_9FABA|nr:hypothetical protein [Stylosanthes scabra]
MNKNWDLSLEELDTPEGAEENSNDENSAATDIDSVDASDGGEELQCFIETPLGYSERSEDRAAFKWRGGFLASSFGQKARMAQKK